MSPWINGCQLLTQEQSTFQATFLRNLDNLRWLLGDQLTNTLPEIPMKILLLSLLFPAGLFAAPPARLAWNTHLDYGLLVDGRDGNHYKTVEIDSLVWFAENLKFVTDSSWCYDNDTLNCHRYGRLYRGSESANACPKGWHLPTAAEWKNLLHFTGDGHAMTRLTGTEGWAATPAGSAAIKLSKWFKPIEPRRTKAMAKADSLAKALLAALPPPIVPDDHSDDRFGFRILPAGLHIKPDVHHPTPTTGYGEANSVETQDSKNHPIFGHEYGLLGAYAYFWSATEYDTTFHSAGDDAVGISLMSRIPTMEAFGFSVRCVESRGR